MAPPRMLRVKQKFEAPTLEDIPAAVRAEVQSLALDSKVTAGESVAITHVNLNDGTVEGLAHEELPLFSVQYHPEASPGPHDAGYLFGRFRNMVERVIAGEKVSGAQICGLT